MSSLLHRYWGAKLYRELNSLINTSLDLVMKDGRTWHGTISSRIGTDSIEFIDFLGKKRTFFLHDVDEIIVKKYP